MKFQLDGQDYSVTFAYNRHDDGSPYSTDCEISKVNNGQFESIAFGCASCDSRDNFDKSKGRKLALAKALQGSIFNKEQREAVWVFYRGKVRH